MFNVVFRRLVRLGSFPSCWRQANVTPIPKGPPPSSVANYRPISITSVLSKVFKRLVSVRLGRVTERSGALLTTQFAYREDLGTCDALLAVSHTLQSVLESLQEAIGSYRFISPQPLIGSSIREFCVGIGGSVLSILTQFLSNRSHHVMVDGCK